MDQASSPTTDRPVSQELAASVQLLTLPVGTYSFTVQGGASTSIAAEELAVPALQVALAPMKSPGTVEFLAGAATLDRWLARGSDMIIVRILGGSASLLLTSVRSSGSSVLEVDVRRLEAEPRFVGPELVAGQAAAPGASGALQAEILAHIQNFGDIRFLDGWAGCLGQKLWIEAFAVTSVGQLTLDSIEYCGATADGFQTPWLSNQVLCGSRGRGMPLVGYAIRLKPEIAESYDCTYSGKFVSGTTVGPCKDGRLCRSDVPGDPLEGIELHVTERRISEPPTTAQEIQYSNAT